MRGMRPSAPTPSGRRRLASGQSAMRGADRPPGRRGDHPTRCGLALRPGACGADASGSPFRAVRPNPRPSAPTPSGRRRLASGQSPPGVGVKGMRPPAYAGFKKRRPPSASLRSLSGGGAIAPTPPERPPFSGGRPPTSPLCAGQIDRLAGEAIIRPAAVSPFAPSAAPPTLRAPRSAPFGPIIGGPWRGAPTTRRNPSPMRRADPKNSPSRRGDHKATT